jgi:tetratricopeptide (TPR) repeat protein
MSTRPVNASGRLTAVPVENRYPGTHAFGDTLVDQLRFCGRADESSLLFHRVIGSDLLVFFGKSGLGKTSLLNARLAPLLRERDFLPLPVRFNQANSALTPMQVFVTAAEEACRAEQIDYTPGTTSSLWEFLKTAIFWRGDRLQVPVLILDQFEEIFTLQSEHFRIGAAIEIGQLISGRLPDHLREQLLRGETLPFGEKAPDVKILIALREDDLGMLQELAPQMPSILQSRFRLMPLNESDAKSAIIRPAALTHEDIEFFTQPFTYEPQVVTDIITAARKKSDGIDPFILQLICRHVEKQVRDRQLRTKKDIQINVDSSYVGGNKGITTLTANFYDRAIKRLSGARQRARAREMCEFGLISDTGRRRSIDKEYLQRRFKVDDASLTSLVAGRLLQSESRHGTRYYEISHDLLAGAVRGRRRWRMPRGMKTGLTIATIAVVILVVYQGRKRRQAEAQRERAERVLDVVIFDTWKRMSTIGEWPLLEKIQQELNHYYDDVGRFGESEKILRRESFAIDNEGDMHCRRGEYQVALNFYERSLRIREQLLSKDRENLEREHDIGLSYEKIGEALKNRGDLKAALVAHQKRVAIMEKLAALKPDRVEWQRDLATSYQRIGSVYFSRLEYAIAERCYSKRVGIMEKLVRDDGKNNAQWEHDLADAYSDQGKIFFVKYDYASALALFEKFKQFQIKFAEGDPADMQWQRGIAIGDQRIGEVYSEQGFLPRALESFKASLSRLEKLTARDPGNIEWQTDVASTYLEIGAIQAARRDLTEAMVSYREDLKITEKLLARDPGNMEWQNHMAFIQQAMGDVQFKHGDFAAALKSFEMCLEIRRRLFERDPNNAHQQLVADTLGRIGDARLSLEDAPGAKAAYDKSVELFKELLKRDEDNRDWQRELSVIYGRLATVSTGDASLDLMRKQLAIAKKLSTDDPKVVSWTIDLAVILHDLARKLEREGAAGRLEAISNYGEAIRILRPLADEDRLDPDAKQFLGSCEAALKTLQETKP